MSDAQQPVFQIQRMYLKDLSLEIPHAPRIFLETQQPTVEIQLDTSAEQLGDGIYEIGVTATVTTKVGADNKTVFLVESKQSGIFEIRNIPQEQMEVVLNIVCPNIVYPYLRANVADLILRAGFPPIHLAEINFEALYQQRLAQQQQQQQSQIGQQPGGAADGGPSGIILPGRMQ
ncbi:MAG TPA: protein-export chaperone SecB [Burkholderiaceae bacterium]|jgi:preprotein translocase subunit SecB|nr:protein-export chaperone SecB [Burkholderiaceae bacterium]